MGAYGGASGGTPSPAGGGGGGRGEATTRTGCSINQLKLAEKNRDVRSADSQNAYAEIRENSLS